MAGPLPQNFASQGKIFIDMPGPRGASKQLLTVKKFDVKEGGSVEGVTTIGVDEGAGHREKQGAYTISMTLVRTVGSVPEVDWVYAKQTKKLFTISTEDEQNGRKLSYLFVRVSKIDSGKDADGMHEDELELIPLRRVEDQ
jgi:hypothetical protein